MTDFVQAFNRKTFSLLIKRTISRIVLDSFDDPDHRYITSAVLFNGFLIDFSIRYEKFAACLISGNAMYSLFEKHTTYSLVNFIEGVREWLTAALSSEYNDANPYHLAKQKKVIPFANLSESYHGLRMLQRTVIDNYELGIHYF